MEAWLSLAETFLEVGVVVLIVLLFRRPIYEILTVLKSRIEGGSGLEAGFLKLGPHPQSAEQQVEKAETEADELLKVEAEFTSTYDIAGSQPRSSRNDESRRSSGGSGGPSSYGGVGGLGSYAGTRESETSLGSRESETSLGSGGSETSLGSGGSDGQWAEFGDMPVSEAPYRDPDRERADVPDESSAKELPSRLVVLQRIAEAENLAMKALQVQYGTPIQRSLNLSPRLSVDGAFVMNGTMGVVEVKYLPVPHLATRVLASAVHALDQKLLTYSMEQELRSYQAAQVLRPPAIHPVLAVVVDEESDVPGVRRALVRFRNSASLSLGWTFVYYSLEYLRREFGLAKEDEEAPPAGSR
jgi:hypothetical protein